MSKLAEYFSDGAYNKVSDADFQTVMKGVGFKRTPRETLTILDMQRYWEKRKFQKDMHVGKELI